MSPVAGLVRLRKHQFGRQADFGTAVPATKAYGLKGVPSVDRQWTDPDIDTGSIHVTAAPFTGAGDYTAPLTNPALRYNQLPLVMCGFFGGQEVPTGGGTAKTWTHEPASLTVDEFDPFTYEFGDDVLTDWYQFRDGIVESFEITGAEGLGPLELSTNWRFGHFGSTGSTDNPVDGTVPTPALTVDPNEAIVYLKDMEIRIADSVAGLSSGKIERALHAMVLRGNQEIDQKRYADGDQSFDIDDYGRGMQSIEIECTFAKTADTVGTGSESDAWMSDEAVTRYVQLVFISKVLAQSPSTFYGWTVTLPIRYYTREEGDLNNNTTVVLTGHAFYDPDDAEFAFRSVLVCTVDEEDLGEIGT